VPRRGLKTLNLESLDWVKARSSPPWQPICWAGSSMCYDIKFAQCSWLMSASEKIQTHTHTQMNIQAWTHLGQTSRDFHDLPPNTYHDFPAPIPPPCQAGNPTVDESIIHSTRQTSRPFAQIRQFPLSLQTQSFTPTSIAQRPRPSCYNHLRASTPG
jgi:hypothetical protein